MIDFVVCTYIVTSFFKPFPLCSFPCFPFLGPDTTACGHWEFSVGKSEYLSLLISHSIICFLFTGK
jgi:hypothetical protein